MIAIRNGSAPIWRSQIYTQARTHSERRIVRRFLLWWSRGESNPGPMTVPTVFYVRSPLAFQLLFCLHLYRGQPVAGLSTVQVPQTPCGSASEASLLNDARFLPGDAEERTERLLAGLILARSSGSESELSAVRFSTYCFAGDIHERTPHSRHASLQRTGHRRNRSAPFELSNHAGAWPDFPQ